MLSVRSSFTDFVTHVDAFCWRMQAVVMYILVIEDVARSFQSDQQTVLALYAVDIVASAREYDVDRMRVKRVG